jgi:hypothetical protein
LNAKRIVIFSVVGGLLIALLTGFVSNTPPMLVGAMWYGYPLAWLIRRVLAPEYFPWRVEVFGLVADIIIWGTVVGVVLSVSTRIWKK